jgi:sec-independent protein translocase protein TatC
MAPPPEPDHPDAELPFIAHLVELRDRLLRMVAAVSLLVVVLFPFTNRIYTFVATPLMARMPAGTSMIATGVASPFLAPFKLTLLAAVALAIPYILYELWGFVAPGLYRHERRLVLPLLASSTLLFYIGMAFAYFVVFPLIFGFFVATAPQGVAVMTDISQYLDFVLTLFFAFGAAFEVPVATILLVWMGVLSREALVGKRPYIIVGAFVVGMFLTPPDVFSQAMLAVPMWLLFEAGVFFSRYFERRQEEQGAPESAAASPPATADPGVGDSLPLAVARDGDRSGVEGPGEGELPSPPPMTDEEMEAQLDAIEAQEEAAEETEKDPVDLKLRRVQALRDGEDEPAARSLLYQVLVEGNEEQRRVARNILEQLDHH